MTLEGSAWIVDVDGEHNRMELTFRRGETFEQGMPVGSYEQVGSSLIATIGDQVRLVVDLGPTSRNSINARLLTKEGAVFHDEPATMLRADWS